MEIAGPLLGMQYEEESKIWQWRMIRHKLITLENCQNSEKKCMLCQNLNESLKHNIIRHYTK